jgi:LCP family protein required for cell wall assembly
MLAEPHAGALLSSNDAVTPGGSRRGPLGRFFAVKEPDDSEGRRKVDVERSWIRRHWVLAAVVATVVVVAGSIGGYVYYLNSFLENVPTVGLTLDEEDRPPVNTGEDLNILLAGADNGPGPSIAEEIEEGTWSPGQHRSDTIMVLHVPAHRQKAFLISIPRDSYVDIYDENGELAGKDKINAAFSNYGPSGYIATVEALTGLRMDHLAIMDWNGFKDLSTAVGGVEVCIPETFYDESQDITWEEGCQTIQGNQALAYVRTRYGLENGDFDRIKRQQNFMRSLMGQILENESRGGVNGITDALKAVTENLTVDESWDTEEIRDLARSMRGLDTEDVTFLTAPMERYDTTESGQSIVVLDEAQMRVLWRTVENDKVKKYLDKFGAEAGELGDPETVG